MAGHTHAGQAPEQALGQVAAGARTSDADAARSGPDVDVIEPVMRRRLSDAARVHLREYVSEGTQSVVYLSTPITTGPRLLDWLAEQQAAGFRADSTPHGDLVRDEVIAENLKRLPHLRAKIAELFPHATVIDPSTLTVPEWGQADYHRFWVEVINRCVDRIVFADGWELSTGCTIEYAAALQLGVETLDSAGSAICPRTAARKLREAAVQLRSAERDAGVTLAAAKRADRSVETPLKDTQLATLAQHHNVASFVSFTPNEPLVRYAVIPGPSLNRGLGLAGAVRRILAASVAGTVNVRTFRPGLTKGNPFHYGLSDAAEVTQLVRSLAGDGYYCIVNETIDIHDGGVSGVTLGGVAEFAPDDTPRAVEKGDAAQLPLALAESMLRRVYGDAVDVPGDPGQRIEFSVHPNRVGQRREQVLVWEVEPVEAAQLHFQVRWPNRFSRHVGDKTYGLLVADCLGLPVPAATVVARRVAPFRFGRSTGTAEWWMRTAPASQTPGHYTTTRGWTDPFAVLGKEDHDSSVAAVLAQEGVCALYSGATLPTTDATGHVVEGVVGSGDDFMLGNQTVSDLPHAVEQRVRTLLTEIENALGPGVRIEWAADRDTVWVLQLHRVDAVTAGGTFSPGDAEIWLDFDPTLGLDALSDLIAEARAQGAGICVTRPVGLTSHVGDLLRKAKVPGRLAARPADSESRIGGGSSSGPA